MSVPLKFILLDISEVNLHANFHYIALSSLGDRATIAVGYSMKMTCKENVCNTHVAVPHRTY